MCESKTGNILTMIAACCEQVTDSKEAEEQSTSTLAVLGRMWGRLKVILVGAWIVFKTPSFLLILVGNIIGTVVGLSMGYKVLYFQVAISFRCSDCATFRALSRLPCKFALQVSTTAEAPEEGERIPLPRAACR